MTDKHEPDERTAATPPERGMPVAGRRPSTPPAGRDPVGEGPTRPLTRPAPAAPDEPTPTTPPATTGENDPTATTPPAALVDDEPTVIVPPATPADDEPTVIVPPATPADDEPTVIVPPAVPADAVPTAIVPPAASAEGVPTLITPPTAPADDEPTAVLRSGAPAGRGKDDQPGSVPEQPVGANQPSGEETPPVTGGSGVPARQGGMGDLDPTSGQAAASGGEPGGPIGADEPTPSSTAERSPAEGPAEPTYGQPAAPGSAAAVPVEPGRSTGDDLASGAGRTYGEPAASDDVPSSAAQEPAGIGRTYGGPARPVSEEERAPGAGTGRAYGEPAGFVPETDGVPGAGNGRTYREPAGSVTRDERAPGTGTGRTYGEPVGSAAAEPSVGAGGEEPAWFVPAPGEPSASGPSAGRGVAQEDERAWFEVPAREADPETGARPTTSRNSADDDATTRLSIPPPAVHDEPPAVAVDRPGVDHEGPGVYREPPAAADELLVRADERPARADERPVPAGDRPAVDDEPTVERPWPARADDDSATQRLVPPPVAPGRADLSGAPGDEPRARQQAWAGTSHEETRRPAETSRGEEPSRRSEADGTAAAGPDGAGSPGQVTPGAGAQPVPGDASPFKRLVSAGTLIWVLLALFGFTLVVQLRSNNSDQGLASARQDDLVRILSDLEARDTRLQAEIAALEQSQRQLTSGVAGRQAALAEAEKRAGELGLLAGTLPGRGPGLEIRIDGVKASAILNAVQELRGAGGEVMQLSGSGGRPVRIVASTFFVDAEGGGISADGERLRGPYVLTVIGVPQTMQTALEIPGGVVASVNSGGGSVTMQQRSSVDVTAVREAGSLQYARPVS